MNKHRPIFHIFSKVSKHIDGIPRPFPADSDPKNEYHTLVPQTNSADGGGGGGLYMVSEIRNTIYTNAFEHALPSRNKIKGFFGDFIDSDGGVVLKNLGPLTNCIYVRGRPYEVCDVGLDRVNSIDDTSDVATAMAVVPTDPSPPPSVYYPHFEGSCFVRLWRHKGKNMFSINNKADAKYSKTASSKTYTELCAALGLPTHTELFGKDATDTRGHAYVFCVYSKDLQYSKMPYDIGAGKLFFFGDIDIDGRFRTAETVMEDATTPAHGWLNSNVRGNDWSTGFISSENIEYPRYGGTNITTIADAIIDGEQRQPDLNKAITVSVYPTISKEEAWSFLNNSDDGLGDHGKYWKDVSARVGDSIGELFASSMGVLEYSAGPHEFIRHITPARAYQEFILGSEPSNIINRVTYFHLLVSEYINNAPRVCQNGGVIVPSEFTHVGGSSLEEDARTWSEMFNLFTYSHIEKMASIGFSNNIEFFNMFNPFVNLTMPPEHSGVWDLGGKSTKEVTEMLLTNALKTYELCLSPHRVPEVSELLNGGVLHHYSTVMGHFVDVTGRIVYTDEIKNYLPKNAGTSAEKRYNSIFNTCFRMFKDTKVTPNDGEEELRKLYVRVETLIYTIGYDLIRSAYQFISASSPS